MKIALNTSVNSNATVDVSDTSNKIIVIPQTIAAGTEIFDVLFTVNGEDIHFYYSLTSALRLNKGVQYTYTLNVNTFIPAEAKPVDLGLPSGLKWAAGNIGTTNPEDYGLYFAWGETTGYTAAQVPGVRAFDSKSYKASTISADLTLEQDAAHVNLGGRWRMPTQAECQELIDNTTQTWTNDYNGTGVRGYIFTSKVNGNSVFFPAAGGCYNSSVNDVGLYGGCWSASWRSSSDAWDLYFDPERQYLYDYSYRYCGFTVRGVCK